MKYEFSKTVNNDKQKEFPPYQERLIACRATVDISFSKPGCIAVCSSAIYRNVSLAALFCGHPKSGAQFFTLVIMEAFSLFVVIISIKLWFGASVQLFHQVRAKVTFLLNFVFTHKWMSFLFIGWY